MTRATSRPSPYIYTVDVAVKDEAAVLARFARDSQVRPTPDMDYQLRRTGAGAIPAPAGDRRRAVRLVRRPDPGADRASGPSSWSAARWCASARRTPGACGGKSVLNPESNVQFGEGGAGTFSDGKLYSQIKDPRHLGRKVLTEFVKAGAPEEILTEAHPHIGTFRLVTMVEAMRADHREPGRRISLPEQGHRSADWTTRGACAACGWKAARRSQADHVVLALGHSARDTFQMLHDRGVAIEAKPFSIGFRIEHPQGLIDKARFGRTIRELGAAEYKLVHHAQNGRSVYSFCMCPGGTVVAAAIGAGPRRHQRHEPIFAQRAQRQCRHRGRHHAGGGLSRPSAGRHRACSGNGKKPPFAAGGEHLCARRRSWWAISSPAAPSTALGEVVPSYRPGVTPTDLSHLPARLCHRRHPRGPARLRPPDQRLRPCTTRC